MTSSNGNIFRITGPLWGESTGRRWFSLTKATDAELWCFLWCRPEQTSEQTIETPVFWDAWRSLYRHCNVLKWIPTTRLLSVNWYWMMWIEYIAAKCIQRNGRTNGVHNWWEVSHTASVTYMYLIYPVGLFLLSQISNMDDLETTWKRLGTTNNFEPVFFSK